MNTEAPPILKQTANRRRVLHNPLVLFALLPAYYLQLAHHVLWRDEFNVWGIACVSQTFADLIHRVRYEAHPALWYVLAYGASRISHAPWIFKLLQGTICTIIYLVVAVLSPFVWWEVALVLLGYYVSYQYTVLCRMYGLVLLVALIYTWRRVKHPERPASNAIWLALLANIEVTGGILACGFLAEMAWERIAAGRRQGKIVWTQLAAAGSVFLLGCVLSVIGFWPAKDIGWSSTGRLFSEFFSGEHIGSSFAKWSGMAFFPATVNTETLWVDPQLWPHALLLPMALACLIVVFWRRGRMATFFGTVALIGMIFANATNVSGVRHYGIEVIAFIAALWIMRAEGVRWRLPAYALLGFLVIATVQNIVHQWGIPYADDDDVAAWIRSQGLENMPIFGSPGTYVVGVTERLGKPMYQLDCQCWDPVMTFAKNRDSFHRSSDTGPRLVAGIQAMGGREVLFLMNRPLTSMETSTLSASGVDWTWMASFERGYIDDEHFFVYKLKQHDDIPSTFATSYFSGHSTSRQSDQISIGMLGSCSALCRRLRYRRLGPRSRCRAFLCGAGDRVRRLGVCYGKR